MYTVNQFSDGNLVYFSRCALKSLQTVANIGVAACVRESECEIDIWMYFYFQHAME